MERSTVGEEEESSAKRKRGEIHQQIDRLSDLPPELLVRILSLMPTNDAVKTGTLSKKWDKLWTRVENFSFVHGDKLDTEKNSIVFMHCFDRILMQCTSPKINKFELNIYHDKYADVDDYDSDFDDFYDDEDEVEKLVRKWLQFAISKNVDTLILKYDGYKYDLPDWFYQCSSLINLELYGSGISLCNCISFSSKVGERSVVSWTSLKSLSLTDVECEDEEIASILSGCPALETLSLCCCLCIHFLHITSPNLKRLEIVCLRGDSLSGGIFKISAPWLKELEIEGAFEGIECQLVNMPSLVNVGLTFEQTLPLHHNHENVDLLGSTRKLLESVHHVDNLTLGPWFIQVLSILKLVAKPSPLFNCKHLTVYSPVTKYDLPGIVGLLQGSPHLEMFVMNAYDPPSVNHGLENSYKDLKESCNINGGTYLDIEEINFLHLKNATFLGCNCLCPECEVQGKGESFEAKLNDYITAHASNLEKFTISWKSINCRDESNGGMSQKKSGEYSTGSEEGNTCKHCGMVVCHF